MFSLSSMNTQFLLPLPHLVAAFNSLKSVSNKAIQISQHARKKIQETLPENYIICPESLAQVSLALHELGLANLPEEWKQLLSPAIQPVSETTTHLEESFISADSFFENKHGFPQWQLHQPNSLGGLLQNTYGGTFLGVPATHHSNGFQSVRGFKTKLPTQHRQLTSTRVKENDSLVKDFFSKIIPQKRQPKQFEEKFDHALSKHQDVVKDNASFKTGFIEGLWTGKNDPVKTDRRSNYLWILFFVVGLYYISGFVGPISRGIISHVDESVDVTDVTFDDVQGIDEAKTELEHIVSYLRDPSKFTSLGGRLPKGVLLVGKPGTGKTLLARAVAGEAKVPFFYVSGSDFDHMFVGSGAKKVRDLFSTAKAVSPCVIFIDELDSVGGKRTSSPLYPYARQTINQLLAEMDGFKNNEGVIVLAASNFPKSLDSALTRPGRFDMSVNVPLPDVKGRGAILKLYLGKVIISDDIDVEKIARRTVGFTGADLENVVNTAALEAATQEKTEVDMKDIEFAMDKIQMGPERRSAVIDKKNLEITAFHEGGHALVAYFTKDAMEINKATIMPRGPSLGHVSLIPGKDQWHETKAQLLAQIDVCMGGRVAEEIIFGEDKVTSGASSDFEQATSIATMMVTKYGMSEKLGVVAYDDSQSPETKATIDSEIRTLLKESYERAKNILKTHSKEHRLLAAALLQYETLTPQEITQVIQGKQLKR